MTAKRNERPARLLERIAPAVEYGRPIAFLATTYEFDPQFFESEFLPALLGLGAWNDRSWAGRVALENALGALEASTVLVDQRSYRGRPRSLRLDVRPAVGPRGELLHAKVLLVVHEHAVRLNVASANLTQAGYRENREVALPLIASAASPGTAALVRSAIENLPEVLAPWWSDSADTVLAAAEERLSKWTSTANADVTVLWSGGDASVWRPFLDAWPNGERVERISVVSPFWSQEGDAGPLTRLTAALRERGALVGEVNIDLYVEAEPAGPGTFRPCLPPLGEFAPAALGARIFAHAVDPLPREDPAHAELLKRRKLHAKVVVLHGSSGCLAYAGSANFSAPGWGFATRANIEAGVRLYRRGDALAAALLPPTTGEPVEITSSTALPMNVHEAETAVPTFLLEARLQVSGACAERLELVVRIDPDKTKGEFVLRDGSCEAPLLSGSSSSAAESRIPLTGEALKRLLVDPRLRVAWWGSAAPGEFPVNVDLAARAELPVVPGGGTPDERMLLAYYQGRVTLAELYPPPPDWQEDDDIDFDPPAAVDTRVDTSRIQSYQVREFVEALQGIRDDLRLASSGTPPSMRAALTGPVSPVSLARQVKQAALAATRTPTAAGFQLAEIALCLKEAADADGAAEPWTSHVSTACLAVQAMLDEITRAHPDVLTSIAFRRYVQAILGGGKRS